jgi:hypothetical protein
MKKYLWVISLGFIMIIVSGLLLYNSDYLTDKRTWDQFKTKLKTQDILNVEIHANKVIVLKGMEKDNFISVLKNATFDRGNEEHKGSTGVVILIKFNNGSVHNIEFYGERLDVEYNKRRFFVNSDELERMVDSYGIKLN